MKLHTDRRMTEYWLQEALEKALFHRFCLQDAKEKAIILHGKRHGDYADFALLGDRGELSLVEVKPGAIGKASSRGLLSQLSRYVRSYGAIPVQSHAVAYCRHGVDVASWFEYRDAKSLETIRGRRFGRLIIEGAKHANFRYYLEGANNPARAYQILCEDYLRIVGHPLETSADGVLRVRRCIIIAQEFSAELEAVNNVPIEKWKVLEPAEWLRPL